MSLWQHITLGRYYPGGSFLHQLDPRTKLLLSVSMMVVLMLVEAWPALLLWLVFLLAVGAGARLPLRLFTGNLRAFLWLFGITIIIHALSDTAAPHVKVWGISFSMPGLVTGGKYALRLALLVVIAALLSLTTIPTDLTAGLERLLRPLRWFRLPVDELALMTALALRFVPTIVEEAQRIQRAQISRGAQSAGGPWQRVQALVPMLVPLFVSTFNRADELAVAMEARCYGGGQGRVPFHELAFALRDAYAAGATAALTALTLVLSSLTA